MREIVNGIFYVSCADPFAICHHERVVYPFKAWPGLAKTVGDCGVGQRSGGARGDGRGDRELSGSTVHAAERDIGD